MSGRVVGSGRIKVDVQRAAQKLRDHLLTDPSTWLCEVFRAATLSRATSVHVDYDANDLYVRFDGDPWPHDLLDRAGAQLGGAEAESVLDRRLRMLTIALFAALGDEAQVAQVFVRDPGSGAISGTRLDRSLLDDPARPKQAADPGPGDGGAVTSLCVHVRRGATLKVLRRALTSVAPPELARLRDRLSPAALPLLVNGERVAVAGTPFIASYPVTSSYDVALRVLAHASPPEIEFSELGLRLVDHHLGDGHWANFAVGGRYLPIRVVVSGNRIPTNVSRSRVRDDVVAEIAEAAVAMLPSVLSATTRALADAAAAGDAQRVALLADVLGSFALVVDGARERGSSDAVLEALTPVLNLPLLIDACGRPRSVAGVRRIVAGGRPLFIRKASEPLASEYLPFVHNVFWEHGRVAERVLHSLGAGAYKSIANDVERGVKRRRVALAAQATPFEVASSPEHAVVKRQALSGASAIVALRAPGPYGDRSSLRLFVDGHVLETMNLEPPPGGIPFDAAVSSPSLHPTLRYDAVSRDQGLESTLAWIGQLARAALTEQVKIQASHRANELRAMVVAAASAEGGAPALEELELWPLAGGSSITTAALRDLYASHGGLRHVLEVPEGWTRSPGSAPVLLLAEGDRSTLRRLFGPAARLVDYTEWLARPRSSPDALRAALRGELGHDKAFVHVLAKEALPCAMAPARGAVILRMHRGTVIMRDLSPELSDPVAVAIDEEYLLPGVSSEGSQIPLPAVARGAANRLLAALVADPRLHEHIAASPEVGGFLCSMINRRADGGDHKQALLRAPMFRIYEGGALRAVSALAAIRLTPTPVPTLDEPPAFEVPGLVALVGSTDEQAAFFKLTGRARQPDLVTKQAMESVMRRREALEQLLLRPELDAHSPPAGANLVAPRVAFGAAQGPGISGFVTLLAESAPQRHASASVFYQRRLVGSYAIEVVTVPLAARVDLPSAELLPGWNELGAELGRQIIEVVEALVASYALELLKDNPLNPFESVVALSFLEVAIGRGELKASHVRRSSHRVTTALGGQVAWSALCRTNPVQIATRTFGSQVPPPTRGELTLLLQEDPRGAALRSLLAAMNTRTVDMTEEIEDSRPVRDAPPALQDAALDFAEPAASPALRAKLSELRNLEIEGVIELIDGRASSVVSFFKDGTAEELALGARAQDLPCAIRARVRAPGFAPGTVLDALVIACGRLLRSLAGKLDALPSFVRLGLCRHVLLECQAGRTLASALREAPIFPGAVFGFASLDELQSSHLMPGLPLPERELARRALGVEAPALPALVERARTHAIVVAKLGAGELCILRPGLDEAPLAVRHLGAEVGTIASALGHPITGAVELTTMDAAALERGRADEQSLARLSRSIEVALLAAFDRENTPGTGGLVSRFVDEVELGVRWIGWFWIPAAGEVSSALHAPDGAWNGVLRAPAPLLGLDLPLPFAAHAMTTTTIGGTAAARGVLAVRLTRLMLAAFQSALSHNDQEELLAYLSLMAMGTRSAPALEDEALWLQPRWPLARGLARWAPEALPAIRKLVVDAVARRLAASVPAPVALPAAEPPVARPAPAPEPPPVVLPPTAEEGPPPARMLSSLLSVFGVRQIWNAPAHPLVIHLERVMARLPFREGTTVAFARSGRPVTYDASSGRIVLNTEHEIVIALSSSSDFASLAAAAMAEVNRALEAVGDHEECRALSALLQESE